MALGCICWFISAVRRAVRRAVAVIKAWVQRFRSRCRNFMMSRILVARRFFKRDG
ncbi:MAG: hypothetical protein H7836_11790 [Magnetococcus sp. YQC-3]